MLRKFFLSAALAAGLIAMSSPAAAAVKQIDFTINNGAWNHINGANGPYGLSLDPTIKGSLRFDDTKGGADAFVGLNYVTGSRTWTLADIEPLSSIYYAGGAFSAFVLYLGPGNVLGSHNTAGIAEGANTLYCNNCVSITSISAVPEPQSWALMIAGFGLLGGVLRQRKAAVAVA